MTRSAPLSPSAINLQTWAGNSSTAECSIALQRTFLVLGFCFTSQVPLIQLPVNWAVWPTSFDLAICVIVYLWLSAYYSVAELRPRRLTKILTSDLAVLLMMYIAGLTILSTIMRGSSVQYPAYCLGTLVKWWLAAIAISHLKRPLLDKMLTGFLWGAVLNAIVCVLQKLGLFPMTLLTMHINPLIAGPWQHVERDFILGGAAVGFYSYSRIATGFLLGIAYFVNLHLRDRVGLQWWFISAVLLAGIGCTGSRTAFLICVIASTPIFWGTSLTTFRSLAMALMLVVVVATQWERIAEEEAIGRLFGRGNQGFATAIEDRLHRQLLVFTLDWSLLSTGAGIGNLGSVIDAHELGDQLDMYRAHGYFFSYLGEIGIIGSVVLYFLAYQLTDFQSRKSLALMAVLLSVGFSDDFMIPHTVTGNIPVMCFLVLILCGPERFVGANQNAIPQAQRLPEIRQRKAA